MSTTANPRRYGVWLLPGLMLWIKLWLTRGQTVCAAGPDSSVALTYLEAARQLSDGQLAGFQLLTATLSSGWYAGWIALNHWLGLPLLLANQIAYAGAAAYFAGSLKPLRAHQGLIAGGLVLLLVYPMGFDAGSTTYLGPAQLQPALTLLALGAALRISLSPQREWLAAAWLGLAAGALVGISLGAVGMLPGLLLAGMDRGGAPRTDSGLLPGYLVPFTVLMAAGALLALWPPSSHEARPMGPGRSMDTFRPLATFDSVLSSRGFTAFTPASSMTAADLTLYRDMTGEKLSPRPGDNPPTGPAQGLLDWHRVGSLQSMGKFLRTAYLWLFVATGLLILAASFSGWMPAQGTLRLRPAGAALVMLGGGTFGQAFLGQVDAIALAGLYPLVPAFCLLGLAALRQQPIQSAKD